METKQESVSSPAPTVIKDFNIKRKLIELAGTNYELGWEYACNRTKGHAEDLCLRREEIEESILRYVAALESRLKP